VKTLALDIGATKIAIALLDGSHSILDRMQISSLTSAPLWPSVREVVEQFDVDRIGVASAGPIDRKKGTISPVNISQWRNFPIINELNEIFPGKPAGLLGDGTAVALAENKLGAGLGVRNMLGVVVSTGIGGGLIIDGKAFHGETGNAALFGHHSIGFDSDIRCECGRLGCLEAFARGPKMVEYAMRLGWNEGEDFIALSESARQANPFALEAIDKGSRALAVGITNVLNTLDLQTVVIGGGVSFAGPIYWEPFLAHFNRERKYAGNLDEVTIHPAKLRADAGLIGASLFAEEFV
jgi:glucokinase